MNGNGGPGDPRDPRYYDPENVRRRLAELAGTPLLQELPTRTYDPGIGPLGRALSSKTRSIRLPWPEAEWVVNHSRVLGL